MVKPASKYVNGHLMMVQSTKEFIQKNPSISLKIKTKSEICLHKKLYFQYNHKNLIIHVDSEAVDVAVGLVS